MTIEVNPGMVGLTGRIFMFFFNAFFLSHMHYLLIGGRTPRWSCLM